MQIPNTRCLPTNKRASVTVSVTVSVSASAFAARSYTALRVLCIYSSHIICTLLYMYIYIYCTIWQIYYSTLVAGLPRALPHFDGPLECPHSVFEFGSSCLQKLVHLKLQNFCTDCNKVLCECVLYMEFILYVCIVPST